MSDNKAQDLIGAIKEKGKKLEAEMSFFDHIDVLRKHLLRSLLVIVLITIGAFYFYDFIFNTVIMGPKDPNFWTYRMMCKLVAAYPSLGTEFCITEIKGKIINTEMAGQFTLQINSCVMTGVIFGVPYILFELWLFIKPALHDKERKSASGFVFFSSLLFLIGIMFGYFIICPLSINFLTNFSVSPMIENTFTIDSYLSSVMTLTIGTGIIFELPVLIYILSLFGIMTPAFMRASRRYAIVIILIIAAIVTPTPDMVTMMVVAFPLFILYELSIFISASIERKKNKELYGTVKAPSN
ncbi:twin-arginine translocase subunit TatC [Pedobacter antarcticus]|uniref:Sec-independent protein translocase protein TatC n=2 Tax=Pedobacter antarcticus TaxID=34086 RepID=A0A081PGN5_9SPHI|nr:twin-arginine translocase subunit TatC [Pedobacter antarcticus]KEQ29858.1 preprotein translocase subunit TatC [Pedobacter antarcticus 4BY]SDM15188.1 sec-independent protein translocase protein TatC [Pedobacter antarcticus]SFF14264.1 Sec-independent protein translocase TatC [Pedobacter antarcticus]